MSLDAAVQDLVNRLTQVQNRLSKVEGQLAAGGGAPVVASDDGGAVSSSVEDFQNLIDEFIKPLVEHAGKIDGGLKNQAELVLKAVEAQKSFLQIASESKKPEDATFAKLIEPTSAVMMQISELREAIPRSDNLFNFYSTLSEGINALGWIAVPKTPGPHINDMRAGAEFYSNRILKEYKGKSETQQVDFVNSFIGFLKELFNYVKQHHTTGVSWNPNGKDASAASVSSPPAAAAPASGGPPPPMPDKPLTETAAPRDARAAASQALFAEINKVGEGGMGLRKVTADMKTKNQPKTSSLIKGGAPKAGRSKTAAKAPAKPPKFELEGTKWLVDFQVDNKNIVIENTEPRQSVYIYQCQSSTIVIKGKINAITMDGCTRTAVVFDTAIASCELVNCRSAEIQCTDFCPAFSIDTTSGCQLYLADPCRKSEIVHSKSSEMNIFLPATNEGEDGFELPIPEQFKTTIDGNKLITNHVEHV